jgi:hypothetical protein
MEIRPRSLKTLTAEQARSGGAGVGQFREPAEGNILEHGDGANVFEVEDVATDFGITEFS